MNSQPMLLYTDAIEHLVANMQAGNNEKEARDIRHAIQNAYNELVYSFDWKYYWNQGQITLNAPYSTGTIEYDHTGGTSERLLTLNDGTWPDWAKLGRIKIGNVIYPVADRLSSTELQLDEFINPGADVTAGTSFLLYQSTYSLPMDLRRIANVHNESGGFETAFVTPNEWLRNERQLPGTGGVLRWTVLPDPDYSGNLVLAVDPPPATAATLAFIYQRSARPIRLTGLESGSKVGTVAAGAGSTTITGSGTAFTASMVGSFLRIGTANHEPTGYGGPHPYEEQRRIVAVGSSTSLTVFPALTYAHSGVKYQIADPLDIWQGMQRALLRFAERELAIARKNASAMERIQAFANDALRQARESDAVVMADRVAFRGEERAIGEGFNVAAGN